MTEIKFDFLSTLILTEKLGSSFSNFSFVLDKYLSLSQASDALETSSRIKTSFSE